MEARVAIERLLARTKSLAAVGGAPAPYVRSVMIRRLERFEIETQPT